MFGQNERLPGSFPFIGGQRQKIKDFVLSISLSCYFYDPFFFPESRMEHFRVRKMYI